MPFFNNFIFNSRLQVLTNIQEYFGGFCTGTRDNRSFSPRSSSDQNIVSCRRLTLVVTPPKHFVSDVQTQISADTTRFLWRDTSRSPSLVTLAVIGDKLPPPAQRLSSCFFPASRMGINLNKSRSETSQIV